VPTCFYFPPKTPIKSDKIPIPRGIRFSIDFGIDFFWDLGSILDARTPPGPPKTAPRGRQDDPKTAPRAPKKNGERASFFGLGRQEAPRSHQDFPKTRLRSIFRSILEPTWLRLATQNASKFCRKAIAKKPWGVNPSPREGGKGLLGRWPTLNHSSPEGWWDYLFGQKSLQKWP